MAMHILKQTDKQKKAMYMKLSKKKLAEMLIQANKAIDNIKPAPEPMSFIRLLAVKLCESNLGDVVLDKHSDNSGTWVDLRIKDKVLSISFDNEGEKIWRVGVWKDIVKVVDTEIIFGG